MKRFLILAVAACLCVAASSRPARADFFYDIYKGGASGTLLAEFDVQNFINSSTNLTNFTPTVLPAGLSAPGTLLGEISGSNGQIHYDNLPAQSGLILLTLPTTQFPTSLGKYGLLASGSNVVADDQGVFIATPDTLVVASTSAAIPEPASFTLLSVGAVGLLGYGWRRRRRAAE